MRERLRQLRRRAWRTGGAATGPAAANPHAAGPGVAGPDFTLPATGGPEAAPSIQAPGGASASVADVGLTDLVLSGWFQNAGRELFSGVPIAPEHTVVDVGCGDGGQIGFCARLGAHVIGIDLDPAKIERLGPQLRDTPARHVETYVSDGARLPLADAIADVVICTEVLEHVGDPADVLRELARIGKPGARYVLSVPDPSSEHLLKATAPAFYFEHPHHVRIVAREEFEAWVRAAGLTVERHEYIGAYATLYWMALFLVGEPRDAPPHPILHHWTQTWAQVLAHPEGLRIKQALDAVIPRTQVIVARKQNP